MTPDFLPKDPSTGVSVFRWMDLARIIESVGGGALTAVTPSIVGDDDAVVADEIPLTVSLVSFSAGGLVKLRLEGGTNKTKRYVKAHYTITTADGPHTDNCKVGITVRHT